MAGAISSEIKRLVKLQHPDPHAILGAHPQADGVVIRTFRPGAHHVLVVADGMHPWRMAQLDAAGLFEVLVKERRDVFRYELRIQYPNGAVVNTRDPYSFTPTLGDVDLHLWGEGNHERIYEKLGAHVREIDGSRGVAFAVWAPNARSVSVVGDFNDWDGRLHMMRSLGTSGVWELFIPGVNEGALYKFELRTWDGHLVLKADPFALATEKPPATASVVFTPHYQAADDAWIKERAGRDLTRSPISIYEVHLGSWRRVPEDGNRQLTFREVAPLLADYVKKMGFTHVELLPVMAHPFSGSWGYQVTGYYATAGNWGTPDDFRFLVDHLHQQGIGVILDWVPAHFPADAWSLGRFDGTALYEHLDPRLGRHPEWDTYIFNYGRNEVRNFLMASALYWLNECHVDGLRVDAVASMLYLDYARRDGDWIRNAYGGHENLDAVAFIKWLNETVYARHPGIMMIAEESTSWAGVSRPTYLGGLGFGFKWDMGWMHDTLEYFSKDPVYRRYHHRDVTFGFLYAWTENFILPLSHDEVVHGKRSMLSKMPGDRWRQFANLRSLYGYMWARPGKKMIFMGNEFGQWREWNHDESLDWHLLQYDDHRKLQALVCELNRLYRDEPALWESDVEPEGFRFVDPDNADDNVIAFIRYSRGGRRSVLCVSNFSPVIRKEYRVGVSSGGLYREILNTDSEVFGGGNVGNGGGVTAEARECRGMAWSLSLTLPPLATIWFSGPGDE